MLRRKTKAVQKVSNLMRFLLLRAQVRSAYGRLSNYLCPILQFERTDWNSCKLEIQNERWNEGGRFPLGPRRLQITNQGLSKIIWGYYQTRIKGEHKKDCGECDRKSQGDNKGREMKEPRGTKCQGGHPKFQGEQTRSVIQRAKEDRAIADKERETE